jgi:hypothetical protein
MSHSHFTYISSFFMLTNNVKISRESVMRPSILLVHVNNGRIKMK